MAAPLSTSVKRQPDSAGDDIATLTLDGKHVQVTAPAALTTRYDEASSTIAYVGLAAVGSVSGSAVWRIKRVTTSSGDVTVEYADGNALFDNVWDQRASLAYS